MTAGGRTEMSSPCCRASNQIKPPRYAKWSDKIVLHLFATVVVIRLRRCTEIVLRKCIFREEIESALETWRGKLVRTREQPKMRGTAVANEAFNRPNVCSPTPNSLLRHRKFSPIWPGIRTH